MAGSFLALIFFFLNPPPAPPPGPPADGGGLTAEQMVEYEARYEACAGAWDPGRCRADLYDEFYG